MEHDREAAEHDLSWIERLIASERAGGPDQSHQPDSPADPTGATRPSLTGLRPAIFQEDNTE
jgi:hypothetical protein